MDPLNELEWLLEVSPECQADEHGMASMERLLATSIEHLTCVSGGLVLRNGLNVRVRGRSAESLGRNLLSLRRLEKALIEGIGSGDAADLIRVEKTCAARGGKRVAAHKSKRTPGKLFAVPRRPLAKGGARDDVGASGVPTANLL